MDGHWTFGVLMQPGTWDCRPTTRLALKDKYEEPPHRPDETCKGTRSASEGCPPLRTVQYAAGQVLFLLLLYRAPQNVRAHTGFLCDKTAVLGAAIQNAALIGYVLIWKSVMHIIFL